MSKVWPLVITWLVVVTFITCTAAANAEAPIGNLNKWMVKLTEEKQVTLLSNLLAKKNVNCDIVYMQEIGTFMGHVFVSVLCSDQTAYMFRTSSVPVGVWGCGMFEERTRGVVSCFRPLPVDERNSC